MDYPLGELREKIETELDKCLNPYSNGLPSRGLFLFMSEIFCIFVLIPILMDYPLGETNIYEISIYLLS